MNKKGNDGEEFRRVIADMSAAISGFSIGDLYPSIKLISVVTGMKRKLQELVKRLDMIMDPIIQEHLSNNKQTKGKEEGDDIVDILLKYHKDNIQNTNQFSLTTDNIKAIVFVSSFWSKA